MWVIGRAMYAAPQLSVASVFCWVFAVCIGFIIQVLLIAAPNCVTVVAIPAGFSVIVSPGHAIVKDEGPLDE